MSYQDYTAALELVAQGRSFYSLVMAAMMRADSDNKVRLQTVFPWVWAELVKRYDVPNGLIGQETNSHG